MAGDHEEDWGPGFSSACPVSVLLPIQVCADQRMVKAFVPSSTDHNLSLGVEIGDVVVIRFKVRSTRTDAMVRGFSS